MKREKNELEIMEEKVLRIIQVICRCFSIAANEGPWY
jgi:hypothetical protein